MVLAALAVVAALLTPADAAALPSVAEEPAEVSIHGVKSNAVTQAQSSPSRSQEFKSIAAGVSHTCAIRADNTATCWGENGDGKSDVPAGSYKSIAAGWRHTCAIRADNTAVCWGRNGDGQSDVPSGSYKAIAVGGFHTCAIRADNTAVCWGRNGYGWRDVPAGSYKAIAAGEDHTCAIRADNTAVCWGGNYAGQSEVPAGTYQAIAAGEDHTCAIRVDNTAVCWGDNGDGKSDVPAGSYKAVAAGDEHTCAIRVDNTATCWGAHANGQSDVPSGSYKAIAVGGVHTCAIRVDNTATCWGWNIAGQSEVPAGPHKTISAGEVQICAIRADNTATCWGDNGGGLSDVPAGTYKAITADGGHACAIRADNTATCWRDNRSGKSDVPAGSYKAIAAGGHHTCAIRADNTAVCWGSNGYGQRNVPAGSYKAITAGYEHTCAIRADNTAVCWGGNKSGQRDVPAGSYKAVTAGDQHTCAIRADNTAVCWGDNDRGQSDVPAGSYKAITAGGSTTCAIRADNTAVCWGDNDRGQSDVPAGSYKAIAAGGRTTCAIRADGVTVCWGARAMRTADPVDEGSSAIDDEVPDETPGSVEDDPGRTPATQTTITTEEVSPEPGSLAEEEVPEAEGIVTVLDADDIVVQLAKVSGLRYDFGAERAVWEPVPGARSYLLAMWDGEQTRQLNVECCSYIIYLSQSDVEQINVSASNSSVNNPVKGPWSGWVNLLPEKVSDLQYERRPAIYLGTFGTVAFDDITWRPVTNASAYDLEWSYSGAGSGTIFEKYDISPECAPRCRSYLFRRPATESRFRVRASNAAGKGPWSDWSSIRPERPGEVTRLRHDLAKKRLVWSRASGAATYVVRLWDGETARNVEQDTCCSYAIDAKRDGITHFAVQATNSGGSGPWSDWQRILDRPDHVRRPRVESHGLSGLEVTWQAPIDSGSSPISHYEVRYTRGNWSSTYEADGRVHTKEDLVQGAEYNVWLVSVNKDGLRSGPSGAYGTVASDPCPSSSTGDKYETKGWRTEHVHALQDFWLLKVTNDGRLVKDSRISKGTKGGEVEKDYEEGMTDWNLKQSGCSWIDESSEVFDRAKVYDNARIEEDAHVFDNAKVYDNARVYDDATVRDHARVYGDAEVWGNDTEIKDYARVYDDAKVSGGAVIAGSGKDKDDSGVYAEIYGKAEVRDGAVVEGDAEVFGEDVEVVGKRVKIYGSARVYGNAKVSGESRDVKIYGDAQVFGEALVVDGMEIHCTATSKSEGIPTNESCLFDGKREYKRAARRVYTLIFEHLKDEYKKCNSSAGHAWSIEQIEKNVESLLSSDLDERQVGIETLRLCLLMTAFDEIVAAFGNSGSLDVIAMIVSYMLPVIGVAKLGLLVTSVAKVSEAVLARKNFSNVEHAEGIVKKLKEEFDRCDSSCRGL